MQCFSVWAVEVQLRLQWMAPGLQWLEHYSNMWSMFAVKRRPMLILNIFPYYQDAYSINVVEYKWVMYLFACFGQIWVALLAQLYVIFYVSTGHVSVYIKNKLTHLTRFYFTPSFFHVFLTLDSAPHCCSPAEISISDWDTGFSGPQEPCCSAEFTPSRRCSGLNGTRLSSKNCLFAVILTSTSPHFISSPTLSGVPAPLVSTKENTHGDSKTTKTETNPVYFTRVAIFDIFDLQLITVMTVRCVEMYSRALMMSSKTVEAWKH